MTVVELIERLADIGATVRADGDQLAVRFPEERRQEVEELGAEIRRLKADLMQVLDESGPLPEARHSKEETRDSVDDRRKLCYGLRWADPYWLAVMEAQERLGKLNWPPNLGAWLRLNHHEVYRRLFEELPEEINRLWDIRADLEGFRIVLDDWVDLHRKAVEMSSTLKR